MVILFCSPVHGLGQTKTKLVIAGAGPSTKVVELLAREFSAAHSNYEIEVPVKSIKHRGGLAWATTHRQMFGRLGRPVSEADWESFPTARELPVAKIKLGFAVSRDLGVEHLTAAQWKDICTGAIQNWQVVGGPDRRIILLGREKGEASTRVLINDYPFWKDVVFHKIYRKDHLMIGAITTVPGAIGFAAAEALSSSDHLTLLRVDGFNSGQQVGLSYDEHNESAETVSLMKVFVNGKPWRNILTENGFVPLDDDD